MTTTNQSSSVIWFFCLFFISEKNKRDLNSLKKYRQITHTLTISHTNFQRNEKKKHSRIKIFWTKSSKYGYQMIIILISNELVDPSSKVVVVFGIYMQMWLLFKCFRIKSEWVSEWERKKIKTSGSVNKTKPSNKNDFFLQGKKYVFDYE